MSDEYVDADSINIVPNQGGKKSQNIEATPKPESTYASDEKGANLEKVEGSFNVYARNEYSRVFVTNKRIIVANTGGSFWLWMLIGWIGSFIAEASSKKRGEELEKLTPESIAKSNSKNLVLSYDNLTKIELKKQGFLSAPKIVFHYRSDKTELFLKDKGQFEVALPLLKRTIGNKVVEL